ncbi:DUF1648 domain-containing protein [Streptomyces sp. P1-3]|uniref:DUF1648 domain-containing protein n=1 Tax=Streptomyces sp. P1-3 TaxID=3421658 RepID=UPI003D36AFE7
MSLPFGLAAVAALVAFAALRDRLPDPVATHFSADGGADGFSGRDGFLGTVLGVLLGAGVVFGVLTYASRTAPSAQRVLAASGCAVAALLATAFGATAWANAAADGAAVATLPGWLMAVVLAAAAAGGGLGWLLAGADPRPSGSVPAPSPAAPRLALAEGEVVTWTRTVGSRVLPPAGVAIAAAGAAIGLAVSWGPGFALLGGGVPMALLTGARVTVDRRGVTVAPLLLPRPRMTVPLERIEEATAREVRALRDFGGWGYRVRPGAGGVILRSGGALSMRLAHGSEFVVTVDDAHTAAALLNALAARERATGEG